MSNIVELSSLFHRSKDRILELGEVFTPEKFVDGMLDLLTRGKKNFWNNEELVFFEPSCGHGNIVLPIFKRRLEAIYKKAEANDIKNPALYSVANAVNTLWAIDIDSKNIQNCRTRLFAMSLDFLREKTGSKSDIQLIQKNQKFFTHLVCALKWQIHENEALSSLSTPQNASRKAGQTRIGGKWFRDKGHREIDFDLSWATYFRSCEKEKVAPLDFERSQKFIESLIAGSNKGYADFEFAKLAIAETKVSTPSKSPSRATVMVGV